MNKSMDFEQEVKQANEFAKSITINQVPLLIMSAMAGRIPTLTNSNMLMAGLSDDIKGLIFTKDDLVNIIGYVTYGLSLPQDDKKISEMMPYTEKDNQYLNIKNYKTVFEEIRCHCTKWDSLEKGTIVLGTDLKIYANTFCNQGEAIISVISAMPVYQQACQTVGDVTIEFSGEDFELKGALVDILKDMKANVTCRRGKVKKLSDDLESFKEELNQKILPDASNLELAVSQIDLTDEKAELQKRRATLEDEIANLEAAYKKLVGYAFTGASGLIFGVIGIISWAITGGVFGKQAEDTRKKIAQLKQELNDVRQEIEKYTKMDESVSKMKNTTSNITLSIENAIMGVRHLDSLWESVETYIVDAKKELDSVTESKRLIAFKTNIKSCIQSWSEVEDITTELVDLFDEALKEIYGRAN